MSLLDAFDLPLATAAAGMNHDAPALRLLKRPFVHKRSNVAPSTSASASPASRWSPAPPTSANGPAASST
ncbi:hypothetical protein ACIRST_21945 [Kitasatospora sp. NPDC101447]|uniref:hypothetical protein n=1 Tax=Kitasatospora sp. NPDC101447 TaxID=3364102 RepID=UPI0037FCE0DA